MAENQDQEKGLWKKIWALECPNKVRNLIWRACRNSLPSKCNLVRRTIISEQSCDRYKEGIKMFCTRCGAAKSWMEFGEQIIYGAFGTNDVSLVSANSWPNSVITKGIWSCLHSPFGPFSTKEIR